MKKKKQKHNKKQKRSSSSGSRGKSGSSTQNFTQELNREIFFTLYLHNTLRTSSLPAYLSKPQAH